MLISGVILILEVDPFLLSFKPGGIVVISKREDLLRWTILMCCVVVCVVLISCMLPSPCGVLFYLIKGSVPL